MSAPEDFGLDRHLDAWRSDSLQPPRPIATAAARRAMLASLPSPLPLRRRVLAGLRLEGSRRRLVAASLAGAVAVMTPVAALGWDAPAGSPLHVVGIVKQRVALDLPGLDHVSLALGFAEQALSDARGGQDAADNAAEAASLLDGLHGSLPANHTSPLWTRWTKDETELGAITAMLAQRGSASPPATPVAPEDSDAPSGAGSQPPLGALTPEPDMSTAPSSSPSPSHDDGGGASARPSPGETGAAGSVPSKSPGHGGGDN